MTRPVALLDVDHTLVITQTNEKGEPVHILNEVLLDSLLKNGVMDIYLFTDMTFRSTDLKDRMALIERVKEYGFNVHGCITPNDLGWSIDAAEADNLVNDPGYRGKLEGLEFEAYIAANNEKYPTITALFEQGYNPTEIGQAFNDASQKDQGDVLSKSYISKGLTETLAAKNGYGHSKGLMLDMFLQRKPEWVGDIVVADDNDAVNDAINHFKPVNDSTIVPHITMIKVDNTNFNANQAYYDAQISSAHNHAAAYQQVVAYKSDREDNPEQYTGRLSRFVKLSSASKEVKTSAAAKAAKYLQGEVVTLEKDERKALLQSDLGKIVKSNLTLFQGLMDAKQGQSVSIDRHIPIAIRPASKSDVVKQRPRSNALLSSVHPGSPMQVMMKERARELRVDAQGSNKEETGDLPSSTKHQR